jgi:hypothetical protein
MALKWPSITEGVTKATKSFFESIFGAVEEDVAAEATRAEAAEATKPRGVTNANNTTLGEGAGTALAEPTNVAIGNKALQKAAYSKKNVAVGYEALALYEVTKLEKEEANTGGHEPSGGNVAIGGLALGQLTKSATGKGNEPQSAEQNTAVGGAAMKSLVTGAFNVAVGYGNIENSKTAYGNTAIGANAMENLFGESAWNVAIGLNAMQLTFGQTTEVKYNVAIGPSSLRKLTTGKENVAIGLDAGEVTTTGSSNVFIGAVAGFKNTTGSQNVFVGAQAGERNTTGSKNTVLGYFAGPEGATEGGVYIGYEAGELETESNRLYIANSNTAEPLIKGVFPNVSLALNATSIGFFKAAAVTQPKTTLTIAGVTLGKAAAPTTEAIIKEDFEKTTFTGNTGAAAYTISDVVRALKELGLMKS